VVLRFVPRVVWPLIRQSDVQRQTLLVYSGSKPSVSEAMRDVESIRIHWWNDTAVASRPRDEPVMPLRPAEDERPSVVLVVVDKPTTSGRIMEKNMLLTRH